LIIIIKNIFFMNQKTKKQLTYWLSVIVIGIALGLGLQFVRAWTEPATAPPGGNVGAPINTSATAQTKAGGFNILGFLGVGINSPTKQIDAAGEIKSRTGFCINDSCISSWPSGGGTAPASSPVLTGGCSYHTNICYLEGYGCSSWGGAYCSSTCECKCNAGSLSCNVINAGLAGPDYLITECGCYQ
jgi:hypothetical protein